MVKVKKIKEEIKKRIDKIPQEKLEEVLEFIKKIESSNKKVAFILSFAGIWKDLDKELFNNLTINLHSNRIAG